MGFQDDWMMRQIEMMTRFVANVVFGQRESDVKYEIIGDLQDITVFHSPEDLFFRLFFAMPERHAQIRVIGTEGPGFFRLFNGSPGR